MNLNLQHIYIYITWSIKPELGILSFFLSSAKTFSFKSLCRRFADFYVLYICTLSHLIWEAVAALGVWRWVKKKNFITLCVFHNKSGINLALPSCHWGELLRTTRAIDQTLMWTKSLWIQSRTLEVYCCFCICLISFSSFIKSSPYLYDDDMKEVTNLTPLWWIYNCWIMFKLGLNSYLLHSSPLMIVQKGLSYSQIPGGG